MNDLMERILRAPEGGGGGQMAAAAGAGDGAANGAGSGAGAGDGGAGNGAGGGAGGGGWTPPQGFPDSFRGSSAEESLVKLLAGYTEANTRAEGLRTKIAQLPKAPEKPDGYTYTPSEKLAPFFSDLDKSPAWKYAREAAHAAGIPADALPKLIEGMYGPMAEQGLLAEPYSPERELKTFMEASGLDRAATAKAMEANLAFAKGITAQLKGMPEKLKPGAEAALLQLTDTAEGNALLSALSARLAESGFRVSGEGGGAAGPMSEGELKKLDGDPRIDPSNRDHPDVNRRFDADLRKRYDEGYQRIYGTR